MGNRKRNSTQRSTRMNFVLCGGLCESRQQARTEARGAVRKPARGADTMCSPLYPHQPSTLSGRIWDHTPLPNQGLSGDALPGLISDTLTLKLWPSMGPSGTLCEMKSCPLRISFPSDTYSLLRFLSQHLHPKPHTWFLLSCLARPLSVQYLCLWAGVPRRAVRDTVLLLAFSRVRIFFSSSASWMSFSARVLSSDSTHTSASRRYSR